MDPSKVRSFKTFAIALEDLVPVLQDGLKSYFEEVDVSLVDTPNFSEAPYGMAIKGLHGYPTIADVGGVHNLIPHVNLDSKYSLLDVTKTVYDPEFDYPISIFGPGGGAFYDKGFCCEFMGSATYDLGQYADEDIRLMRCGCRYAYVDEDGGGQWREQVDDDKFGLMGNFYLCQDMPGRVLKVHVKKRIGEENFTEAIRAVLLTEYGTDKPISMGGVFLINSGVAKLHIMPKHWPEEPSTDESVNNEWLKYYEITKHPLVCLTVFHSHDPGFNLRMEHTHCYNLDTQDESGHYHYDVTPDTIEYEGYFNTAAEVFRLDGP